MRSAGDVAVVGGGHNALVAATLLARAGLGVTVFERLASVGGAATSAKPFPGVGATVSPYAYLVSLFPTELQRALGIALELRARHPAACAPDGEGALVIDPADAPSTRRSFEAMGLGAEHPRFTAWSRLVTRISRVVFPTFLEPLRPASWFEAALGPEAWDLLAGRPLGASLEACFDSDLVRGMVLTDGLIGTYAHSAEPTLRQNRCFAYHVAGGGGWRVPVGGMGALSGALAEAARHAGVEVRTNAAVVSVSADGTDAEVVTEEGTRHAASVVLGGIVPAELDRLLGRPPPAPAPEGAQVKVNLILGRLPPVRAGVEATSAFTGTLHVNEGQRRLDGAFQEAGGGHLPRPLPCDVYCHSLSDPSVLPPDLQRAGAQTLSVFCLQTPARLFGGTGGEVTGEEALAACLDSLQSVLAEPLEDCLLHDEDGRPCIEVHTPADLERDLGMTGGNIFHGDLAWPWAEDDGEVGRWGAETDVANVFVCGAGARRGGGVSGIGGHNAAMAALAHLRQVGTR